VCVCVCVCVCVRACVRYLISKPRIQIFIVICEIHQLHRHFSHGVLLLRSLEICL